MDRIGDYPDLMRDLVNGFTEILLTEEVREAAAHLPGPLRTRLRGLRSGVDDRSASRPRL
jgi:hypothetical protein